jgi:hypothetical protein
MVPFLAVYKRKHGMSVFKLVISSRQSIWLWNRPLPIIITERYYDDLPAFSQRRARVYRYGA